MRRAELALCGVLLLSAPVSGDWSGVGLGDMSSCRSRDGLDTEVGEKGVPIRQCCCWTRRRGHWPRRRRGSVVAGHTEVRRGRMTAGERGEESVGFAVDVNQT